MKWSRLFMLLALMSAGVACSDDDSHKEEDEVLDMSGVLGQSLYYNKWLNNKNDYTTEGMVDVIRFGQDGKLWEIDFGGHNEKLLGTWKENTDNNQVEVSYEDGEKEIWHVLSWKNGIFTVMVNKGKREYIAEDNSLVDYLKNMSGDAFFLTEVEQGGSKTSLRVLLEGEQTVNVREAKVILDKDQEMELVYVGNNVMMEKEAIEEEALTNLGMPGKGRDVIFYVNEGSEREFKFSDYVYADGFTKVDYKAFDLRASNTSGEISVNWKNPYSNGETYCQVEVLSSDEKTTYFKSDLEKGRLTLDIDNTTKTISGSNDIRKLLDKGRGTNFIVRLSVVLLEPGISSTSSSCYINRQAVTNVTVLEVLN